METNLPAQLTAGQTGMWEFVYTADSSVAIGGSFRIWSPQNHCYRLRYFDWSFGQVSALTDAACKPLASIGRDEETGVPFVIVLIAGSPLETGQSVRVIVGDTMAGMEPARVQMTSARTVKLVCEVDLRGRGEYTELETSPVVEVLPAEPDHLEVVSPSDAMTSAIVKDCFENVCHRASGDATVTVVGDDTGPVSTVAIDGGKALWNQNYVAETSSRLRVELAGGVAGLGNPVHPGFARPYNIYFGDLHAQSGYHFSRPDVGTTKDLLEYARDVARLDFVASGDFVTNFYRTEECSEWWRVKRYWTREYNRSGEFVTFLGYEWPSPYYGHRNVFFPGDDAPLYRFSDEFEDRLWWYIPTHRGVDLPPDLWKLVGPEGGITIPHHMNADSDRSADEIDISRRIRAWAAPAWDYEPNNEVEPLLEIYQGRGSFEQDTTDRWVRMGGFGRSAQDWLRAGFRVGFAGGSNDHLSRSSPAIIFPETIGMRGGLTGVLAESLTRQSLFEAIKQRRTYATNGLRILLRYSVNDVIMGGDLTLQGGGPRAVTGSVVGTADLERVDVLKNNRVVFSQPGGSDRIDFVFDDNAPAVDGDFYYVRAIQNDDGIAWGSPVWIRITEEP